MTNLHLRGLDEPLVTQLKQTAAHQGMSLNSLILNMLRQSLGLSMHPKVIIYHDLDQLADTWTRDEAKTFMKNISHFEKIDADLWK